MEKKYVVGLTEAELSKMLALIRAGKVGARRLNRGHILLLADDGQTDAEIAGALHVGLPWLSARVAGFVEGGLERALNERPPPGAARKLGPQQEAYLVALACSDPPEVRTCWTMQLLADRLVELGKVDSICDETVRRVLKKRHQAVAEATLVDPDGRLGVRGGDGRSAGAVCRALRSCRGNSAAWQRGGVSRLEC